MNWGFLATINWEFHRNYWCIMNNYSFSTSQLGSYLLNYHSFALVCCIHIKKKLFQSYDMSYIFLGSWSVIVNPLKSNSSGSTDFWIGLLHSPILRHIWGLLICCPTSYFSCHQTSILRWTLDHKLIWIIRQFFFFV